MLVVGRSTAKSMERLVDEKRKGKDMIAVFGRYFTSTPDLPFRVKEGIEFDGLDMGIFFSPKEEKEYLDQKYSKESEATDLESGGKR